MATRPSSRSTAQTPEQIERDALERISPTPETLQRVEEVKAHLLERASELARRRELPLVRCLVAGSAARATFLADRLDIDLFLLFPPSLDRKGLEQHGLALARDLLEKAETRYAEHPYLRGMFEGFAVDAVPGYAIEDPSHPLSAVDRTPFHQAYLQARSTPQSIGEVRLAKQFLRALGVYGSEARTGGFSGYLVELLVVRYGTLRALLTDARHWRLPVRLPTDPSAHPRVPDDVALILDDPVDPNRNVATALSRRNLGLFILAAGAYLDHPSPAAFVVRPPSSLKLGAALERLRDRQTHVGALELARPPLVDDILYPQLRKAERALAEAARRLGFEVIGTASAAGDHAVSVLIEVGHPDVPRVRVHDGPPAGIDRGSSFLEKWTRPDADLLQGPYVTQDGGLAVDARRAEREFEPLLTSELPTLPLGRDLKSCVGPATVLQRLESASDTPELGRALADLLDKRLPWLPRVGSLEGE